MAMKQAQRQVYRSMQGKEIDLDKLRMRNEMTIAVGNARVNARGDELGPGGKIIKKREEVMNEYYSNNPISKFLMRDSHQILCDGPKIEVQRDH